MSHDVLAELQGYRNEHVIAERAGRKDRVEAIGTEIDRVKTAAEERAAALETSAKALKDAGQDVRAAELEVEARRYRDALAEPEDASQKAPQERAVPKKAAGK